MCGRFTLRTSPRDLVEIFQLLRTLDVPPRYNIAPTQDVLAIRQVNKFREPSLLRWGLVPSWSKDPKSGPPLINARGETLIEKPTFPAPSPSGAVSSQPTAFTNGRKGRGRRSSRFISVWSKTSRSPLRGFGNVGREAVRRQSSRARSSPQRRTADYANYMIECRSFFTRKTTIAGWTPRSMTQPCCSHCWSPFHLSK